MSLVFSNHRNICEILDLKYQLIIFNYSLKNDKQNSHGCEPHVL